MHDIDHKDGNVAQGTAPRSQVGERLVAWSINDKKPRNFVFLIAILYVVYKGQGRAISGDLTLFITAVFCLMASTGK